MSVHSAGGAQAAGNIQNPANIQAKEMKAMLADFQADMFNDLKDLKEELSGKVTVRDPKKDANSIRESLAHIANGKEIPPELAAEMAAVIHGKEEVDKKRKKRKKFEEKLEQFSEILDQIDPKKLSDEEQKILEQFKKNLRTMKRLSRELKLLETEEEELADLIKQLQEREKNKEQQEEKNKKQQKEKNKKSKKKVLTNNQKED